MGTIRITGGTHRSRQITVLDAPGLRPTTDRVREVLFNWLGQQLDGLRVLDLFAGSGILGLEAASRGAKTVTWVDNQRSAIEQISNHCESLQLESTTCLQHNALDFCRNSRAKWDLIFLDPPFAADLLDQISDIISGITETGALLYREYAHSQSVNPLDSVQWHLHKHKKVGQVMIELWQKQ